MHYKCSYHNWKQQSGGLRGKEQDQQRFYAKMSRVAYGNTTKGRATELKKYGFKDWIQDEELSTEDVAVLYNPKTKEMISSVTGSRFTDKKHQYRDIRSDIGITFGTDRLGKRTREVKSVVRKAQAKYSGFDHTLTGHSLGGKTAQNISKSLGIPTVAFNIGSSPMGSVTDRIARLIGADHKKSKVIHYTTNSLKNKTVDPLSMSEAGMGTATQTIRVKKTTDDFPHALSHFGAGKKKKSPWLTHVSTVRGKHPGKPYSECLRIASASYKKK
jgi:hypothetical protein